jgi:hypothetical protein
MPILVNAGRATITGLLVASTSKFISIGTGATAEAVTQTALVTEVETRATGTQTQQTTSVTNDTYQDVGTITATAARAITESGIHDASTAGNMLVRALFSVVNLAIGDSIQLTWKLQFT